MAQQEQEAAFGILARFSKSPYRLVMTDRPALSRIYLLRHARAGWAEPGQRDYDRVLDQQGREDAGRVALAMAVNGFVPQLTLCSAARRCTETYEIVSARIAGGAVVHTDALYAGDHHGYIDLIREREAYGSIMIVGHNPMMENTAQCLLPEPSAEEADLLRRGFPTAGLAVIDIEGSLASAGKAPARLAGFLTPQDV